MRILGKKDLNSIHLSQSLWFNFAQHCFLVFFFFAEGNSEESLTRGCQNYQFGETENILATLVGSVSLTATRLLEVALRVHRKGSLGQDVDQGLPHRRQIRSMTHCQSARVLRLRTTSQWRGHVSCRRKVEKQIRQKP